METGFITQYERRGKALTLRGTPVKDMQREELIAVIGFLFEQAYGDVGSETQPSEAVEIDLEYPPSNNGLMEG
jgi:hypothetical protein